MSNSTQSIDSEKLLAVSIDQYLMGLASSVYRTQRRIGKIEVPGPMGQPASVYSLPRLDFELKLMFMASENSDGQTIDPLLRAYPAGPYSNYPDSTLKGTFLAAPSDRTVPAEIKITLEKTAETSSLNIYVKVLNEKSQPITDLQVDFNIDKQMSKQLNQGDDTYSLSASTGFITPYVFTDEDGIAQNTMYIDEQETSEYIAAAVSAAEQTKIVVHKTV